MPLDPLRVKALFNAALDLPDPTDRPAFLDRECGDDLELRRRLDELMLAYDRPALELGRPLAAVAAGETRPETGADRAADGPDVAVERTEPLAEGAASARPEAAPPDPLLDTVIAGRYKIRKEIGEGGMGTVYLADQTEPVKRQVALKLIRAGMDSRAVLARFESERQALALMDHPNIAKVLDAGATENGRPFFVMELVNGVPLTGYCDQHRLGLSERLALFRQICSAVQHAHQKGIIHRDLKPTNILVESHDGKPVPKVIDFGLAKATGGLQLTEHSLSNAFGFVAGTPLYMAPEQAQFNALDVDTRADVYALGVILYEMLTGSTPIRRETFQRAALDEILRVIREDEPPTPSSRISTSEALPSISANRQIEPARLSRFVRGDLDWIVMKALSKERQRRYESAIAFAQDVERFTNHEPVSAGPPTAAYRFKKFVRRNRPQVVAATLVLLALVVGIVGTTLGLFEARRQERRAEARLVKIENANEILGSIFKNLNPKEAEKDDKPLPELLGERLDQATAQLAGDAIGDPLAVARMQLILGESQRGLGYPKKAIALLTKARATLTALLGPDHPETLQSMGGLAEGYHDDGQPDRALTLREETLTLMKLRLGPDHPGTLVGMNNLAEGYRDAGRLDRALPLFEEALPLMRAKLGAGDAHTIATMDNLARGYRDAGQPGRALPILEEALALTKAELGAEHPRTIIGMGSLALGYRDVGRLDRALPLFEEALPLMRAKLGAGHPDTLAAMSELALGYRGVGRPDQALPLYEEVLTLMRAKLGAGHPKTVASMSNLATAYQDAGRLDRALPLYEETLALMKAKRGADHRDTLLSMGNLAQAYRSAGQLSRALPLLEETLSLMRAKLGPDHPDTLINMGNLALCYQDAGRLDRALPLFEESLAIKKAKRGPDHPSTLIGMNNLALGYKIDEQFGRALPLLEEALSLGKAKFGPDHPETLQTMGNLAACYEAVGRIDRALPLFEEALALKKAKRGADHPETLSTMNNLAMAHRSAGRLDRALPLLEETLALRKAKLGADHPQTIQSMNNLALGYQDAGRLDRALPLFEESLALVTSKLGPDHPHTLLHTDNLAGGYEAAGRLDRALPHRREAAAIWRRRAGADSPQYARALIEIAQNLVRGKMWTEAESTIREALAIREAKEPDAWTTFNTRSLLGAALLGQKKYSDAEPLLRTGYDGMKRRADKISPKSKARLADAVDRLIELAEATNRPDDVKRWKEEKATLPVVPALKPQAEKK